MNKFWLFLLASLLIAPSALAGPSTQAGPYRVEITTDPAEIPVGKANLHIQVTDSAGEPVEGAQVKALTGMPGMFMGEQEQVAQPRPGEAGVYVAPTAFPMAGDYRVTVSIVAEPGPATAEITLRTGLNTAPGAGGVSPWIIGLGVLGAAFLAFVLYRVWRTGQRPDYRAVFNRQVLGGLALLAVVLAISQYAIHNFRRPGAMTPIKAQGMEMEMPPPPGVTPVELAPVTRGAVQSAVRYTGQAVGNVEQMVYPRVTGTIEWMPFYAGDQVKQGQLLARLDTSQYDPQVEQRRAAVGSARENVNVTRSESRQAQAEAGSEAAAVDVRRGEIEEAQGQSRRAQAEVSAARDALAEARNQARKASSQTEAQRGALEEARSGENQAKAALGEAQSALNSARAAVSEAENSIEAAREEGSGAQAQAEASATQVDEAEAQLQAAQADQEYWEKEFARMKVLLAAGAVSRDEYQREEAQYKNAQAQVRAAQARLAQARANARAAQARGRQSEAMVRAAQARVRQAEAAIEANESRIAQAQSGITGAAARIRQAQADVEVARAEARAAQDRVGQAEAGVRAAQAGAEAAQARIGTAGSAEAAQRAQVRAAEAAAEAARSRIGAAQSGVQEAHANLTEATTTRGYTEIRSLVNGVVTRRLISPGVLVQPGQAILEVAQIRPIRLQANVAETDLKRIEVGALVTVRDRDGEGEPVTARVTSIAPAVDPGARTGIVEAVVPNADARFLPGQFVVMEITTGQVQNALRVPNRAIQYRAAPTGAAVTTQTEPFVWVAKPAAGEAGRFTVERVDVKLGASSSEYTSILAGLEEDDNVVVNGYQYLKSGDTVIASGDESPAAPNAATEEQTANQSTQGAQTATVAITEQGYVPSEIKLQANVLAKVTFTRKTDATCGTEIVIPEYSVEQKLPLNKPVTVEFTPQKSGEFKFTCGMDMLRGKVVVR